MSASADTQLCDLLRNSGTAKELGLQTGRSWRTIQRWQNGAAKPDPHALLLLMKVNEHFAAGMLHLAGWAWAARVVQEEALARQQLTLDALWRRGGHEPPRR